MAQSDTIRVEVVRLPGMDTVTATTQPSAIYTPNRTRVWSAAGMHVGLYSGALMILNQQWYKDYPKEDLHSFDDIGEWMQVDKLGHGWTAYHLSRASMASWQWAGFSPNKSAWLGSMSGFAFQTVIEVLDGFSAEWGWSWGDIAANALGSGMLLGQQLGWGEQRISFKFSFQTIRHNDPELERRSDQLFGSSRWERMLKDYNGQTYWFSGNLKSFFKKSNLPPWLNIAVGHGATGMFGGFENKWTDKETGILHDRTDIARRRQWYLAPDIDFTRIPTQKKWLKTIFFCLNAFKMPAPALEFSNGKFRAHALYF